jgi:hypothetical protein
MQVEVVIPFTQPYLAPFRRGEVFEAPDAEAMQWIAGGLVRPASTKSPEFATAPAQRKTK